MAKRAKKISREAAIKAADEYRKSRLDLENLEAEILNKQALLANEHEGALGAFKQKQEECEDLLNQFVEENREEILANKKSCDFAGVKVGYKKSAAKLVLGEDNTWASVENAVQADKTLSKQFMNADPKLDKTALKKAHKAILGELGLLVEQEEHFFVKL